MPRAKPPPTPASSTELTGIERQSSIDHSFCLPLPAMNRKSIPTQNTPPSSPDETTLSEPRFKRTASGDMKKNEASSYNLPAPPSRPRKIIQMKPKTVPLLVSPTPEAYHDATRINLSKKKQPSATSAAGRKIARKTAHSIIERRRRSKMNEEFGVLKDMIPACEGVEMHKLAILQAGIEYVKYLEDCIEQLKQKSTTGLSFNKPGKDAPNLRSQCHDYENFASVNDNQPSSPTNSTGSTANQCIERSTSRTALYSHSDIKGPRTSLPGVESFTTSPMHSMVPSAAIVHPTSMLSPAFNAMHFSTDPSEISTEAAFRVHSSNEFEPLPLPQSSLSRRGRESSVDLGEEGAEASATAALLMMTTDRRGFKSDATSTSRTMSVKDLLVS